MAVSRGLPYFPFYPEDFMGDGAVVAMTNEQVGTYVFLLLMAWRELPVGSIPDDDAILARWARMTPGKWKKNKAAVLRPWVLKDGRWHQKRMQLEYGKLILRSDKAREAVEARWEKIRGLRTNDSGTGSVGPPHSVGNTDVQRTDYQPESEPDPYSETDPDPDVRAATTTPSSSKALRGGARGGAVPDGDAIDAEWERAVEEALENVSLHGKKDLAFLNELRAKRPRLEPEEIRDQFLALQRELAERGA